MADWGVGSSLRRVCAPTGALVAFAWLFAVSATAAPSPDPPPAPPAAAEDGAGPADGDGRRPAGACRDAGTGCAGSEARREGAGATREAEARREGHAGREAQGCRRRSWCGAPHDRYRVPLAAFVASPSGDSIDRDLLALAGFGLLLVALGGAVVLFAAQAPAGARRAWYCSSFSCGPGG